MGELEFAHWLKDNLGINARRGRQYCGSPNSPDVVSDLPVHWEVKRVQRLNIYEAMSQAESQCGEHIPCVAHRKNRAVWHLTIRASDLKKFVSHLVDLDGSRVGSG